MFNVVLGNKNFNLIDPSGRSVIIRRVIADKRLTPLARALNNVDELPPVVSDGLFGSRSNGIKTPKKKDNQK